MYSNLNNRPDIALDRSKEPVAYVLHSLFQGFVLPILVHSSPAVEVLWRLKRTALLAIGNLTT